MLVVTRKVGESVVIPQFEIGFTVLQINERRVRIGISAPAEVVVHREEVHQRIACAESGSPHDENSRAEVR